MSVFKKLAQQSQLANPVVSPAPSGAAQVPAKPQHQLVTPTSVSTPVSPTNTQTNSNVSEIDQLGLTKEYGVLGQKLKLNKNLFETASQLLESRYKSTIVSNITFTSDPCSVVQVNEDQTVDLNELNSIYQQWLKIAANYKSSIKDMFNFFTKANQLKSQNEANIKSSQPDKLTIEQAYADFNKENQFQANLVELNVRKFKLFFATAPVKIQYLDVMQSLCVTKTDAEKTKATIGYYTKDELNALLNGYNNAIQVVYKYQNVIKQASPQQAAALSKQVQIIIKTMEAEKRKLIKEPFQRLFQGK